MRFEKPIVVGKLVKRYKRFFADIILESGEQVTAHCPNTGSMKSCGTAGDTVILTRNNDQKRKLKYTWEMTERENTFVVVNTALPNIIVKEALIAKQIPELAEYVDIKSEVKYGENSRIDFLLTAPSARPCYVEVKNVTLAEEKVALFPDAITSRGLKHLVELANVAQHGSKAVMFFLVNRSDVTEFLPAWDIDPIYCRGLIEAHQKRGASTSVSNKSI